MITKLTNAQLAAALAAQRVQIKAARATVQAKANAVFAKQQAAVVAAKNKK